MSLHYIWMSTNPHLHAQLRRANEERSAAFYAAFAGMRRAVAAAFDAIAKAARWIKQNHRERVAIRQLHELDDRMLGDIGLPRSEIRSVARALARGVDEPRPLADLQAQAANASSHEVDGGNGAAWRPTVVDGGRRGDDLEIAPVSRAPSVERPFGRNRAAGCG